MATRRNALELYDAQVRKFRQSGRNAVEAWEMLPEGAEDDAYALNSGTTSSAELARQKHPYARRFGAVPKYDPKNPAREQARRGGRGTATLLPINRQSGRLYKAIERQETRVPGALSAQRVGFDRTKAQESLFVLSPEGTTRMVARGYWTEIVKRWRLRNRAFRDVYVRAQRRAMEG
ncbi:MAG: hypothetical protein ACO1SV_27655 [Fimbriimonas sp.]